MNQAQPTLIERSVDWLIDRRMGMALCALLATAVTIVPSSRLGTDRSIASFFPAKDELISNYFDSKRLFGGDEIIIVAYRDPQLYVPQRDEFDERRLQHIAQFADRLSNVAGVLAHGTQDLASTVGRAQKLSRVPLLAPLKKRTTEMVRRILIGDDNETTAILLRLEPQGQTSVSRELTIGRIRQLAEEHAAATGLATFVVGEPVQVHDMFRYVEEDGAWLGWRSTLVLGLAVLVLFRSPRWFALPLLVALVTVWWTKGAIVSYGMRLTIVGSTIQTLVAMAAAAAAVHVAMHYGALRAARERRAALRETLVRLAPVLLWSGATTAAGFGLLWLSHIHPVRNYGLMMTTGSLLVLAALALLIPAQILHGNRIKDPACPPGLALARRLLSGVAAFAAGRRTSVLAGAAALAAVGAAGAALLRIETDFSRNFRAQSTTSRALEFAETRLGGSGMWEVNFPAPEVLDEDYLEKVRLLAETLRKLPGQAAGDGPALTKVVAITDGIDMIPRIPFLIKGLPGQLEYLQKLQPDLVTSLHNAQERRMRFMLRSLDRQPLSSKLALIARVEEETRRQFPPQAGQLEARATGLFVLLARLVENLGSDQWRGALFSTAAVAVALAASLRGVKLGLVALVPNAWALLLTLGAMGLLGVSLNFATGMIACIAMGLTVDSTLHYMHAVRRAVRDGATLFGAVREAHNLAGSALIYANACAMAICLALTTAHFVPLVEFGLLICVTLAAGLVGNLVLLPALLGQMSTTSLIPPPCTLAATRVETDPVLRQPG